MKRQALSLAAHALISQILSSFDCKLYILVLGSPLAGCVGTILRGDKERRLQ